MTPVDNFVLGLVLIALFVVGHVAYFPDNFKELYMGVTHVTHNDREIIVFPNIMIVAAYLACCFYFVKIYG